MVFNMENNKLKSTIIEVLKADKRLWDEDQTELNQTLLLDLIDSIDEQVIDLILQKDSLRDKFFVKIKDAYVFKTNDFKFFMEENKIDNSYTQYKNRIGLTDGKKFLKDTNDVVLNFPYKDGILEGGQSTDEGTDSYFGYEEEKIKTVNKEKITEPAGYKENQTKRKEIFFNQVLAQDEIDRLFDEKALVNWKRQTKGSEEKVIDIKRDEEGIIRENLIIKGNNLLALHSLKKQYSEQIKLIYIDPPYNTGNDGFNYNDKFNHSTWLTFMKNRIEVARDLLKDDGVIFVSLDDKELHYMKVLIDEIFGRENFIGNIAWESKTKSQNTKDSFNKLQPKVEHILLYTKKTCRRFNLIKKGEQQYPENDDKGDYREYVLEVMNAEGVRGRSTMIFEIEGISPPAGKQWKLGQETILEYKDRNDIIVRDSRIILKKRPMDEKSELTEPFWGLFTKEIGTAESAKKELTKILGSDNHGFETVKPMELVKKLIFHASDKNDIILDYHAGSGTTAHAVLEQNKEDGGNRKFILIEQMNYINTITCPRVENVLDKEGIEDSFIYCELAQWNDQAKEEISTCNSLDELKKLLNTLYEKYFLNYNLKIKEFKEKVLKEDNFKELSLDEQKRMFLTMLDLNQMYVQKTEMEDTKFGINKEDIKLTKQFYSEKQ